MFNLTTSGIAGNRTHNFNNKAYVSNSSPVSEFTVVYQSYLDKLTGNSSGFVSAGSLFCQRVLLGGKWLHSRNAVSDHPLYYRVITLL